MINSLISFAILSKSLYDKSFIPLGKSSVFSKEEFSILSMSYAP